MKHILIILFLMNALFLTSCKIPKTAQNSNNGNKKISYETKKESAQRLVRVKSENTFDETYSRLRKAIEEKKPLTIIAELDHSANAKKADLELRKTKVIMFGNPKLGTPLMKANQEIGIDLPQKMLVYEDEKEDVYVVYNDPVKVAEHHKIRGKEDVVMKIAGALKGLAKVATKK